MTYSPLILPPHVRWREPRRLKPKHLRGVHTHYAEKVEELADDLAAEGVIETRSVARSKVAADERAAIDAFIAKKGVRKVPDNEGTDDFHLLGFLASKGYVAYRKCYPDNPFWSYYVRAPFSKNVVAHSRNAFLALVAKLRVQCQMQPIGAPA